MPAPKKKQRINFQAKGLYSDNTPESRVGTDEAIPDREESFRSNNGAHSVCCALFLCISAAH